MGRECVHFGGEIGRQGMRDGQRQIYTWIGRGGRGERQRERRIEIQIDMERKRGYMSFVGVRQRGKEGDMEGDIDINCGGEREQERDKEGPKNGI